MIKRYFKRVSLFLYISTKMKGGEHHEKNKIHVI